MSNPTIPPRKREQCPISFPGPDRYQDSKPLSFHSTNLEGQRQAARTHLQAVGLDRWQSFPPSHATFKAMGVAEKANIMTLPL